MSAITLFILYVILCSPMQVPESLMEMAIILQSKVTKRGGNRVKGHQ